ncbi:hypothetical protein N7495_004033 [Penicillium taxi]|uniref:uncharacterized protein n=1 Tax=Penicillium taxi TaxID=168475 RepID=UPI0025459261|nr:uncharacterized protein N7495_004033 [Penicillium taxi]KAJ5899289.1 hypothetical protein N7495_004033 [Penicillium taxi]
MGLSNLFSGRTASGNLPPLSDFRGNSPRPLTWQESKFSAETYLDEDHDPLFQALESTNEDLRHRVAKLQTNTARLRREIWLLQRHIKDFNHPLFENWEADILTRLIEVAHGTQRRVMPMSISEANTADREKISRVYTDAAKQIWPNTIYRLGLSMMYHEALQRYSEVAPYRSPNPFQTEVAFAKWLVEERENKPEKYEFWAKLYPVCYGRTVEKSACIF